MTAPTVDDYAVGDIVAFHPVPDTVYSPPRRWAAPAGALARVVGIDMTWWNGCLIVEWLDKKHGQNDGGYSPGQFRPCQRQMDLLELLEVGA